MTKALMPAAALVLSTILAGCSAQAQRFDWDELGATFCRHAAAEDLAALGPVMTASLRDLVTRASTRGTLPPRLILQSYDAPAPACVARTRNAGIVEIRRSAPGAAEWIDLLVVVPERDGGTRIDDILFSTRSSDTLRERLRLLLAGG